MPYRYPNFCLSMLHPVVASSTVTETSLPFRRAASALRVTKRRDRMYRAVLRMAILVFAMSIGASSYAQDVSPNWDVRVNQQYWDSLPNSAKDKAAKKFRALGFLRGDGKVIPDQKLDPLAIKVEGDVKGDKGWLGGWLNIEAPSSCKTSTGKVYIKGEIRKDTNQKCDCGWLSCGWVDVVSKQ